MTQYRAVYDSPVGRLYLSADENAITSLRFQNELVSVKNNGVIEIAKNWLKAYFDGKNPSIKDLPLKMRGTPFQTSVWRELLNIPYGHITTYGKIAEELARNNGGRVSAQAVGGAIGKNSIAIIVPCHRVIGANGYLTGFAGGLDVKRKLLENEGIEINDDLYIKKRTVGN